MSAKLSAFASNLVGGPDTILLDSAYAGDERGYARDGLTGSKAMLTGDASGLAALPAGRSTELPAGAIVDTLVPRDIISKSSRDTFGPVETPFVDTIPANPSTTAILTIGGSVDSMLDTVGDRDWFRVELVAGQRYTFSINPTGSGDIEDSYLRLHNSAGTQIAFNDDAGSLYSRLSFTATTSGTYYVSVGAYDDAEAGNYRVSAALAPPLALFTNDQIANQLAETFWGGTERHFNVAPGGTITVNITALTAAGQTLAREALALWTDATGIAFSEIAGTAQMRFIDSLADDPQGDDDSAFATSVRIGNIIQSSLVNVGTGWLTTYGTGLNSYSFQTYIHEIGHALGLGHAGAYNGTGDYSTDAEYLNDSWATTIMSYFDQQENSYFSAQGFTRQFVVSPVIADILATTYLYGTPSTTRTGDTTYGFNNNSGRAVYDAAQFPSVTYTVIDHGGTDTLDYSLFTQTQRIDLNAEAFSNVGGRVGNVTIARGSVIENAVGGSGNDTIIGNNAVNTIYAQRGGDDTLSGGGGDDGFYFGGAMTGADSVDGGAGTRDQIGLQGNYAALTLGVGSTVGVELIVLLPGNDNRFGGATGTNLSYNIITVDANAAAGELLTFQANTLRAGENFTLNASAETNGIILTFGGLGTENITGGQQGDGFYFGTGRFGASDTLNGSGGSDQLGFQGDFFGGNAVTFGATQLTSVEFIVLMSANDTRFGGALVGQFFSYQLTMNNGNVLAGQTLVVSATTLRAGELLFFTGVAETDGGFRIFSGAGDDVLTGGQTADEIWGGAGSDQIEGQGGADVLRGGLGNDRFVYNAASASTAAVRDLIADFDSGDVIELGGLAFNTGGQPFAYIGGGAQTGARQVQVIQTGSSATVNIFIDGDATADLVINLTVTGGHTVSAANFNLLSPFDDVVPLAEFALVPEDNLYESHLWGARHDPYVDLDGHARDMVIV